MTFSLITCSYKRRLQRDPVYPVPPLDFDEEHVLSTSATFATGTREDDTRAAHRYDPHESFRNFYQVEQHVLTAEITELVNLDSCALLWRGRRYGTLLFPNLSLTASAFAFLISSDAAFCIPWWGNIDSLLRTRGHGGCGCSHRFGRCPSWTLFGGYITVDGIYDFLLVGSSRPVIPECQHVMAGTNLTRTKPGTNRLDVPQPEVGRTRCHAPMGPRSQWSLLRRLIVAPQVRSRTC